ncbi:MFS transporter [Catenulispora yoronensis]|uniref:MFS transporter n=1 Tax=Catenulispora yoronensis TaxID=450799 RepID=A0ABP5G8K7_9ACTN
MSAAVSQADAGLPVPAPESLLSPRYLALTLGIVSSVLLTAFEMLAVYAALPVAVDAVHGTAALPFCFSAFTTAGLVGMVVSGVRSDTAGPALPFLGGTTVFGIGLLVAGTAGTMAQLVAGRAIQGFGSGLVLVALYVIVGRAYPERLRAAAFAMMASLWVLPSVVGPVVAGILTERASWRWVFLGAALLVPLPVALMAGPVRRLTGSVAGPRDREVGARRLVWFAVLAAAGAGLVQYAGQRLDPLGLVVAVAGVMLLIPSVPKLLPKGTLRIARGLPAVIVLHGLIGGAYFGAESYVTAMLEDERGLSPTVAGLTMVGVTFSWTVMSQATAREWLPWSRAGMMRVGPFVVVTAIAVVASAVLLPEPAAVVTAGFLVGGFGMGMVFPTLNLLLLHYSPPESQGSSSSAMQICDSLGAIALTGGSGMVFHALHHAGRGNQGLYLLVFAMMAVAAVATAVIAPRVGAQVLSA